MNFFTTPNLKNIIATLGIVTTEKSELTFLLALYFHDIINDHKTQGEQKVHSGNAAIDYKTQGERKIQLFMTINVISSKDSDEIRTMHAKSHNKELMVGSETDDIVKEFLNLFQKKK